MNKFLKIVFLVAIIGFAGKKVWNHFHVPELPLGQTILIDENGRELNPAEISQPFLLISCVQ